MTLSYYKSKKCEIKL